MAGYALFISVADYADPEFGSHETVRNSALKLCEWFVEDGLWNTSEHMDNPAGPNELLEGVRDTVSSCGPDDSLLVYFCGHGKKLRRGDQFTELHLAVAGSKPGEQVSQLGLHHLYDVLRVAEAARTLLVLDCCESDDVPALTPKNGRSLTCVLTPRKRDADATGEGRYTAFSGALIDVLSSGRHDAGAELDIKEVFEQLRERLPDAEPPPKLVREKEGPFPVVENVARASGLSRHRLAGKTPKELAEMWIGTADRQDVPVQVIEQQVRARLADDWAGSALAHHVHERGEAADRQQCELIAMIVSGSADVAGATARLLGDSGCPDCAGIADNLLERAVEELDAQHVPLFYQELDASRRQQLEIVLARRASVEDVRAVAGRLPELLGDVVAFDAVDRLYRYFAGLRGGNCVRALLRSLRNDDQEYDAETVIQYLALDLSPVDVAEFAQQLGEGAEQGAQQLREKVVRNRSCRDVAVFVCAFDSGADAEMREVLSVAVEREFSVDEIVRLARALRRRGLASVPSAVVNAALLREFAPDRVNELVRRLASPASDGGEVAAALRDHLQRNTAEPGDLARYLRGPVGEAEGLVHAVVTAHPIGRVIELHEQVGDDEQLLEEIVRAVASTAEAPDVVEFLRVRGDADAVRRVLIELGERRDGRTIGAVLLNWQESTQSGRRFPREEVHDVLASRMSSRSLLEARGELGRSNRAALLDPVVCKAFEQSQRFFVHELAELLADVWEQPGRRHAVLRRCLGVLISRMERDAPSAWVEHLAELVVTVSRRSGREKLFDTVFNDVFRVVNSHDDAWLNHDYVMALRNWGADALAHKVRRDVDAWPGSAVGGF